MTDTPDRRGGDPYPTDQSVGYLVRACHREFQRALAAGLAPHGVSIGQWYFLRILWQEEGLTQRALSARVGMMEPTTAKALGSMERGGLIERRRSPVDRRKIHVHLTPVGRALKDRLLPIARAINAAAAAGLSEDEVAVTRRLLEQFRSNLASAHAGDEPADGCRPEGSTTAPILSAVLGD